MARIITADNGKTYTVRFANNQDFEVQRFDTETGLEKVFVLMDFSLGNFTSKRKEMIWYSYNISPTGARTDMQRLPIGDSKDDFLDFLESEVWDLLKEKLLEDFLRRVETTFIANSEEG